MIRKIAFGGDLHKRPVDITTIQGYVRCCDAVQDELLKKAGTVFDMFISLGDWYDKGYSDDTAASLCDYDSDIAFSNKLSGEFYGVIGNHIRLNLDSNPEVYLIQPHARYKSRRATRRKRQLMQTPDFIRVGNVQISLMHYQRGKESPLDYIPVRQEWAKYHIAVFHIAGIIPSSKLGSLNMGYTAYPNEKITRALENVDLAIVGHIHKPLGMFDIVCNTGHTCKMIVPGSLTNTNAGTISRHVSIDMPIVTVDTDTDLVSISMMPFDLKTNMVTFQPKNVEKTRDKLLSLRCKPRPYIKNEQGEIIQQTDITVTDRQAVMTLNGYMAKMGYSKKIRDMVGTVIDTPGDISSLVRLYHGRE